MTDSDKTEPGLFEIADAGLDKPSLTEFRERLPEIAKLPPAEYSQQRKSIADEYGISVAAVDAEIKAFRKAGGAEDEALQGSEVEIIEPEPWPDTVELSKVLEAATNEIMRFMFMDELDVRLTALWCAHTYCMDLWTHTPRWVIDSPRPNCGKSTLLKLIELMCFRAAKCDGLTPATYFRVIEQERPALMLDEADTWFAEQALFVTCLNSGYARDGAVWRSAGEDHVQRRFSTYSPTALAGINLRKHLPDSTASRSIVIDLQRAPKGETRERLNLIKHPPRIHKIARGFARSIQDNWDAIAEFEPDLPEDVINRDAEIWGPLVTLATIAGGVWPGYVYQALEDRLNARMPTRDEELLLALWAVFDDLPEDQPGIHTDELIQALCEDRENPWATYHYSNFMDPKVKPKQLANFLEPYKVKSKDIRIHGVVRKGYRKDDILKRIQPYLSVFPGDPLM